MKNFLLSIMLIIGTKDSFGQLVPVPLYRTNLIINEKTREDTVGYDKDGILASHNPEPDKLGNEGGYQEDKKNIENIYKEKKGKIIAEKNKSIEITLSDASLDRDARRDKIQIIKKLSHKNLKDASEDRALAYEGLYSKWMDSGKHFRAFPTRNIYFNRIYYGSETDQVVEGLKNGFLKFDPTNGGSIYSEIIAGYGGPFRFSFGGMIAANKLLKIDAMTLEMTPANKIDSLIFAIDSINRSNNSIQRLLGGGGNAIGVASLPVFDFQDDYGNFNASFHVFDKLCFDIPALGNQIVNGSIVNGYGAEINTIPDGKWFAKTHYIPTI